MISTKAENLSTELLSDKMCKISNLFEIANMDLLASKICPKMPLLGLQPISVAPNSTK